MLARSSLLLITGLALASCATTGQPAPALATTPAAEVDDIQPNPMLAPKVYTDGVGIVLELLPLKVKDGEAAQALLRITGAESYVSGVTFRATRSQQNTIDAWVIDLDGGKSFVLQRNNIHREQAPKLYVPRSLGRIEVQLDKEAARRIDVADLIADHRAHLADGSLARLAKFDRAHAQESIQRHNETGLSEFAEKCGKKIAVTVDWESFKDEDMQNTTFCNHALSGLARICDQTTTAKLEIASKLDGLHCKRAEVEDYSYDQGTRILSLRTSSKIFNKGSNAEQIASKALKLGRTLLKSAEGLYILVPAFHEEPMRVFAGKGPKLYRQLSRSINHLRSITLWGTVSQISLSKKAPGKWKVLCPKNVYDFEETSLSERDRVLASATLEEPIWRRNPKLLARDNKGIYYYVDEIRREFGGLGYRVFKGPRGRLKLTTMVDIVDDANGQIFATTTGVLRLILANGEQRRARWLVGQKGEELELIDTFVAKKLIYENLGIYADQDFGTICSMARTSKVAF